MKSTNLLVATILLTSMFSYAGSKAKVSEKSQAVMIALQAKIKTKAGIIGATVAAAEAEKSMTCLDLEADDVILFKKDNYGITKYRAVVHCSDNSNQKYVIALNGELTSNPSDLEVSTISIGQVD